MRVLVCAFVPRTVKANAQNNMMQLPCKEPGDDNALVSFVQHLEDGSVRTAEATLGDLRSLPSGYISAPLTLRDARLLTLVSEFSQLGSVAWVSDGASTGEAYKIREAVEEGSILSIDNPDCFRLVNTGTIDPFLLQWGLRDITYLKFKGRFPIVSRRFLESTLPRRAGQGDSPKVMIGGMGTRIEAVATRSNVLCGKSSVLVLPKGDDVCPFALSAVLNSRIINDLYVGIYGMRGFGQGSMNIGPRQIERLPVPPALCLQPDSEIWQRSTTPNQIKQELDDLNQRIAKIGQAQKACGTDLSRLGQIFHLLSDPRSVHQVYGNDSQIASIHLEQFLLIAEHLVRELFGQLE